MADTKQSDFADLTGANVASGDGFTVRDVSDLTMAATGTNKEITIDELGAAIARLRPEAIYNSSVTGQSLTTTEAYLAGSSIAIPNGRLQAKTQFYCAFEITKTSTTGSTGTPIINLKYGTNGTTADTTRVALTFPAQTAVADNGMIEVWATFRTVGSGTSAVLHGVARLTHSLDVTGLANVGSPRVSTTSGGFDSTVASSILGVTATFGASWAGSINLVHAQLTNLGP